MKPTTLLLAGLLLCLVGSAPAQAPRPDEIRRVRAILETPIDPKDFPDELTLSRLLTLLEEKLPEGKKIALYLDNDAFGEDLPRVAGATNPSPLAGEEPLRRVLQRGLSWVPVEVDYAIRPPGVVVTTPPRATHTLTYDVRRLVRDAPRLLALLREAEPGRYRDLGPEDGVAVVVRAVLAEAALRPWESLEARNGTHLVLTGSARRHDAVADALTGMAGLLDVAVGMNARLYEVERAFFDRRVAPRFAADAETGQRPAVVAIDDALFRALARRPPLAEGVAGRLPPDRASAFLTRQTAYRYAAGDGTVGTGLAGVAFTVAPRLSRDLRSLRLTVTQHATRLVRIDKIDVHDALTGKARPAEVPVVHKTATTGTVTIPDGGAILMPVEAGVPDGKVGVLIARPFVWIDAEAAARPGRVWGRPVPEAEPPPATPPELLIDAKRRAILQAVLADVLTNPELQSTRAFYGTPADRTVVLAEDLRFAWPAAFLPDLAGYKRLDASNDPFENRRRILGIDLRRFDVDATSARRETQLGGPIEVCLFNAGGTANGGTIGGCSVYYVPKRIDGRWTVEYTGLLDP